MFKRKTVVVRRGGNPLLRAAAIGGTVYAGQRIGLSAARETLEQSRVVSPGQRPLEPQAPVLRPEEDRLEKLRKLGELHTSGILTDKEFESEKQDILSKR